MTLVRLEEVKMSFGTRNGTLRVLENLSMTVDHREFVTLFGPNGCGKTTLINIIAGLLEPVSGTVEFQAESNAVAMVFQDYRRSLLPWKNVRQNILFPLRLKKVSDEEAEHRLLALLSSLDLSLDLEARVFDLSGGQSQLVCLLRALITEPSLLILDEPFSALDYQARLSLGQKLMEAWAQENFAVLLISHDLDEALYLGDRTIFLTERPARVADTLSIPFPRPRFPGVYGTPEFARLKRRALGIFTQCLAVDRREWLGHEKEME